MCVTWRGSLVQLQERRSPTIVNIPCPVSIKLFSLHTQASSVCLRTRPSTDRIFHLTCVFICTPGRHYSAWRGVHVDKPAFWPQALSSSPQWLANSFCSMPMTAQGMTSSLVTALPLKASTQISHFLVTVCFFSSIFTYYIQHTNSLTAWDVQLLNLLIFLPILSVSLGFPFLPYLMYIWWPDDLFPILTSHSLAHFAATFSSLPTL